MPPRSARLARRPEVREEIEDEDDGQPGAWMVQPAQPKEVLISDDPPESLAKRELLAAAAGEGERVNYPEWDWRAGACRDPCATVL